MRRIAPLLSSSVSKLGENVALSLSKSRIRSPRDFDRLRRHFRSPRVILYLPSLSCYTMVARVCAARRRDPPPPAAAFLAQRVGKVWSCCLLSGVCLCCRDDKSPAVVSCTEDEHLHSLSRSLRDKVDDRQQAHPVLLSTTLCAKEAARAAAPGSCQSPLARDA
jgi:hypothetical protein